MKSLPKTLVVDDDTAHRKMLEAVLSDEGYQISQAADGAAAVTAVEKQFFDLILMDLRMPRMDGLAAQQRIKAVSPNIPIIMMTAYASVGTAVDALKAGATGEEITETIGVAILMGGGLIVCGVAIAQLAPPPRGKGGAIH